MLGWLGRGCDLTHKVGDVAYVDTSQYGNTSGWKGEVVKVTATGQITVLKGNNSERFNSDGLKIPYDQHHQARLCGAERYAEIASHIARKNIAAEIVKVAADAAANVRNNELQLAREELAGLVAVLGTIIKSEAMP
jgi:hypothetical protein